MSYKFNPFTAKLDKVQDTWISLTDTPASYTGEGGKFVKVNATPDGLEFDVIGVGDLPTGIDAAKIADGSVSNTEFQYLDGLTSGVQTQLDLKLTKTNNLSDLDNISTARNNLGLGTAAVEDVGTGSGNIPQLNASGELSNSVIPALSISEYLGNFTDTTAALADAGVQTSQRGDWFTVNTSGGLTYIVTTDSPTTTGDITVVSTPTDAVSSVNGHTGVVVLDPDDLDDTATTHKFTTSAEISKLSGIESGATADQSDAEIKTAYENNADTNAYTDAEQTKLSGIETGADVTDTANVTAAGALMDSEVDADIKTLALPANTTISTFGKTLIDDADASAARATLGLTVPIVEKSITVESPSSSEDITIFFTNRAITITEMRAVLANGSATPSVTWTIKHSTDRSATGNEVVTGGTTTTSTTTGSDVTSFNDATIPADSFVWLETTAQSGTVPSMHVTLIASID